MSVTGVKPSKLRLTKPILVSPSGFAFETHGDVKDVVSSTKKTRKDFSAATSKVDEKKPPGTIRSTATVYATAATPTSRPTRENTTNGKSKEKVKKPSTELFLPQTFMSKKTVNPKPSTGKKNWITRPIFSVKDCAIILVLFLLIRYLAEHLVIQWR